MRPQTFADVGILLSTGASGEIDTICPQCSPTRKKSRAKCLSVNTIRECWFCHHCGWSGRLGLDGTSYGAPLRHCLPAPPPPRVYARPKPPPSRPFPEGVIDWFAHRGIPERVLTPAGISAGEEYCPQLGRPVLAICFPYLRDGQVINIKYRTVLDKHFWMVRGAERILYGLDDILRAETVCIVEGELDKLSIDTAGGPPTVSVPDGAPPPDAKHSACKFRFLDGTAMARLCTAQTVLIGTDMDAPGCTLADELARRIGSATCQRVSWPDGCKDANEVLVQHGPEAVRHALANAQPFPAPIDDRTPRGKRPVQILPPARGRRVIIELAPVEVRHAH